MANKRQRKRRGPGVDAARTARIKENKIKRMRAAGNCGKRVRYSSPVAPKQVHRDPDVKCYSFEDEYRHYRKTRGRSGLSPNPAKRKEENPMCRYRNDVVRGTNRFFPIGECMENPVTYSQVKAHVN